MPGPDAKLYKYSVKNILNAILGFIISFALTSNEIHPRSRFIIYYIFFASIFFSAIFPGFELTLDWV